MSGHSKWSTIKHKKAAKDAKRSKLFSKLVKEITIAAKIGGADPDSNPRLRLAISNAKGVSVPKDNIERAIKKGGDKDAASLEELTYEGYLSHGIAVFIECLSDNNQRTVSNVRAIFNKYDGNLGKNGSLSFLFGRKGVFTLQKGEIDPDEFELEMIDAGAEDIEQEDDIYIVTCSLEDFGNIQSKLEELNLEPENAELQRIPHETVTIDDDSARKILKVIEAFEEDDDVQNVFHNLEISDELMSDM